MPTNTEGRIEKNVSNLETLGSYFLQSPCEISQDKINSITNNKIGNETHINLTQVTIRHITSICVPYSQKKYITSAPDTERNRKSYRGQEEIHIGIKLAGLMFFVKASCSHGTLYKNMPNYFYSAHFLWMARNRLRTLFFEYLVSAVHAHRDTVVLGKYLVICVDLTMRILIISEKTIAAVWSQV